MSPDKDLLMHVQTVLHHSEQLSSALKTMERNLLSGGVKSATLQKAARSLQARVEPEAKSFFPNDLPPVEAYR